MTRFTKSERIHSKIEINSIFQSGKNIFTFPFKLLVLSTDEVVNPRVKILISVPKKKFSKAVDRNRIKRLVRESYRLNKHILLDKLANSNTSLQIAYIYIDKNIGSYQSIEKSVVKSFDKIVATLNPVQETTNN